MMKKRMMTMTWNKDKDVFYLAVGHGTQLNGKWDSGCAYGKYTEAGLMLPIVQYATKILRRNGIRIMTDADTKNNKNMKACVAQANKAKCKYYMSVHCDYSKATPGVAPLYVSAKGKKMATTIGKSVAKSMGMKWKGAFRRTDLYELNATKMTSVIFETGAIKDDLTNLKRYKKYGRALAKGICKFIGVEYHFHSASYRFRKSLQITFRDMKKLKFKYKGSGNALTWAGAKKKKCSNCATYVCYALQRAKFLKPGQVFYCNDNKIICRKGLTLKQLEKIATIRHPHKSPKYANLKKGDICGYHNPPHTQVFAGWDKNGRPKWYSVSPWDLKQTSMPKRREKYDNKTIDTIIRLK